MTDLRVFGCAAALTVALGACGSRGADVDARPWDRQSLGAAANRLVEAVSKRDAEGVCSFFPFEQSPDISRSLCLDSARSDRFCATACTAEDSDALQQHRQRTRINLAPQPSSDVLNGSETWGKSTVSDGDTLVGSMTLTPATGWTATALQVRHFPVACGNAGLNQPPCTAVPSFTEAHAKVGAVTLVLDDPSAPTAGIAGPADGWTNARSVTIAASGADPQSGISGLDLRLTAGSATRTQALGTWQQDTTGSTMPGWATTQTATSTVSMPSTGDVTITAVTRNGANVGAVSVPVTMRVDRVAPKVTWPRELQGGRTVTVRDPASGLATVTATIAGRRVGVTCVAGSKQCKVRIPSSANGRLRVAATDRAGGAVAEHRDVLPQPRGGARPGDGADRGKKKRPRRPGSKKPPAGYCKKHPTARSCRAGGPSDRGDGPGRTPRGRSRMKDLREQPKRPISNRPKRCTAKRPCKGPVVGLERGYQTVRNYSTSYVIGATALGDEWVGHRASNVETLLGYVRSRASPPAYTGCGFTHLSGSKGFRPRNKPARELPRRCDGMSRGFPGIAPRVFAELMHRNIQVSGEGYTVPAAVRRDGVLRTTRSTPVYRNAMAIVDLRGSARASVTVEPKTRITAFAPVAGDESGVAPYPAATGPDRLPVGTTFRWRYMTAADGRGERYLLGRIGGIRGVPASDKAHPFYASTFGAGLGWVFVPLSAFVPVDEARPAGDLAAPVGRLEAWRVACNGADPQFRRASDMNARDRPRGFPPRMCHWLSKQTKKNGRRS